MTESMQFENLDPFWQDVFMEAQKIVTKERYLAAVRDNPVCFRCSSKVIERTAHRGTIRGKTETICPDCMQEWIQGRWSAL